MEYQSCLEKQNRIINLFTSCTTEEAKYKKIIELGKKLPPLPLEYQVEKNLVKGCQSQLYLYSFKKEDKVRFGVHSNALISAGLAALFLAVYDDETPQTILHCPPDFLKKIAISSSLSPSRINGMNSLFQKMRKDALIILMKREEKS